MDRNTLNQKLDKLSTDELKLISKIIDKRLTLALLYKEVEWMSTHHYGMCSSECISNYSGDTDHNNQETRKKLLFDLFGLKPHIV